MSLDIGVPGGSGAEPGFDVRRGAGGLSIGVGAVLGANAIFGINRDTNAALVNVFPVSPRGLLFQAIVQWRAMTNNFPPYPDPNYPGADWPAPEDEEYELELFAAYDGANLGVWDGTPFYRIAPKFGYPNVITLNESWHSLGVRTTSRPPTPDGEAEWGTDYTANWHLPDDIPVGLLPGAPGRYALAVRAPVAVVAVVPCDWPTEDLVGYGLSAYYPVEVTPDIWTTRVCVITKNWNLDFTSLDMPLLDTPSNYAAWPPTP